MEGPGPAPQPARPGPRAQCRRLQVTQLSEGLGRALDQAPPPGRAPALSGPARPAPRSPARAVAATAAAQEELGEDGGPRGSPQTTRRRCPRARRVPRRQRRALARGQAAWASASLRFLGRGPAASAGAAAAEAKAAARLSPPEQPKPREARRTGWWLAGVRCPRMGILFTRIWRLFNHQGEGPGPRASGRPGGRVSHSRRSVGGAAARGRARGPGGFGPTSIPGMVPTRSPLS